MHVEGNMNKIGIHIQAASAMDLLFYLLQRDNYPAAGYTVVGNIQQIFDVSNMLGPDLNKVTARDKTLEEQILDPAKGVADASETAKLFVTTLNNKLNSFPTLRGSWWQVFNEAMGDYSWIDKFVSACIDFNGELSEPINFVYFNFATGNPPDDADWVECKNSLIKVCNSPHAKIGFHEYGYNGRMLGDGSLEPWRIGRIITQLKRILLSWGLPVTGKARGLEGGLDDEGWMAEGVDIVAYANAVIDAAKKWYENDSFIECYNIYDCSYLANEYSILPQYRDGTDTRFYDTLVPYMQSAGSTPPTPTPDPIPDPTPNPVPTTTTLFDMQFNGYKVAFDVNDKTGDRRIPLDKNGDPMFFYAWNEPADKISHVELFPSQETGAENPTALRIQNQAPLISFWFGKTLDTIPGDLLKIKLESNAIIQGSGAVSRRIVVDLNGGMNARNSSLPTLRRDSVGAENMEFSVTATGPKTTVMIYTGCTVPARVDVDYTVFKVDATTPAIVELPPTWPRKAKTLPSVYIRSTPVYMADGSNIVTILAADAPFTAVRPINQDYQECQIGSCVVGYITTNPSFIKYVG
jgi:hypothetical protein